MTYPHLFFRVPDLFSNTSSTLSYAHRRNVVCIALNPRGNLILSVDEDGRAILGSLPRCLALHYFSFKHTVSALQFSPDGRLFAAAVGNAVEIWSVSDSRTGESDESIAFAPFVHHRTYVGHEGRLKSITWSDDSRFLLSTGKDLTARLWSRDKLENFAHSTLSGHRGSIVGAWFSTDQEKIFTISQDGAVFHWTYTSQNFDPDGLNTPVETEAADRWRIRSRHFFDQRRAKLKCAAFHNKTNMLVAGFTNGIFVLVEMPDFNIIHTLSISSSIINTVTFNASAEWIAFGSSNSGQLLVWEWQSESYILKQTSHFDSITDVTYSPDGQRIITTAEDGKIKVWDTRTGFCVVTFTEHTSSVTACSFARKGLVLFTSSLDGSIRAWDLVRYRNFRTFSAPVRVPFSTVTVDSSNEVVCGGSRDSFEIYIWSVQTGQLLDQLQGHEGPIVALAFTPSGSTLVSGSWDHSVRLWNVFDRTQVSETLMLQADVLALAIRPDDQEVAVSTLDGQLSFWSIKEASLTRSINARQDISGGRRLNDRRTAANAQLTKAFTCLSYSTEGSCVIAGGHSKYICLYDVRSGIMLRKFTISINLSINGTQEFLNSAYLTAAGPRFTIDDYSASSDGEDKNSKALPGIKQADSSLRRYEADVRVAGLSFSPAGREFCVASTEGLLVYSSEVSAHFDPFNLDTETTPSTVLRASQQGQWLLALVLAFRLSESSIVQKVIHATPMDAIHMVVQQLPAAYLLKLMKAISEGIHDSPRFELYLRWMEVLLSNHGSHLKAEAATFSHDIREAQRSLTKTKRDLAFVSDQNAYTLTYLLSQPTIPVT